MWKTLDVNELIESIDLKNFIEDTCGCEFQRQSDGDLWTLSPLSNEKTPSFSLNEEAQTWYCFSTGQGGGLPQFIMALKKCTFRHAVDIMKEYAGVRDEIQTGEVRRLQASQIARRYSVRQPRRQESAAKPLPPDVMDRYEWNPEKLQPWVDEGISLETMREFGVRYDPYSDRIVVPIRDIEGNIINVHGRTVDPEWKEKKLRKYTFFFSQGSVNTIYGFWENREEIMKSRTILLFEGEKSVYKSMEFGYPNAGALLTSHLSENQFKILIRLGLRRVVFCLDSDVDVRQDARVKALRSYTQVEYVTNRWHLLEPKEAPVDRGKEVFDRLYEGRWKL